MNPDHLWALVPALAVVLLHLDRFWRDGVRVVGFVLDRLHRVGAMWR